jgi:hypothetical protein
LKYVAKPGNKLQYFSPRRAAVAEEAGKKTNFFHLNMQAANRPDEKAI